MMVTVMVITSLVSRVMRMTDDSGHGYTYQAESLWKDGCLKYLCYVL